MKPRGHLPFGLAVATDEAVASAKAYRPLQAVGETVDAGAQVLYLGHQLIKALLSDLASTHLLL